MQSLYDTIGRSYPTTRRADPRIAAAIHAALGDAETVLNVGAGTGSYEPEDRQVTALEPSDQMIANRPDTAAPVIKGNAEALPFDDNSFDAAMASLTVHHWTDKNTGLAELRRVSRGPVVLFTFLTHKRPFWLNDYFPALLELVNGQMPTVEDYEAVLGPVEVQPVPIPADCVDGFLCCFWRRPFAYLDPGIREGISSFWKIGDLSDGLKRLEADLVSGAWADKYPELEHQDSQDFGYRVIRTL